MTTLAQLNRIDATTAILTANDGRCWDVYGDNWVELKADAENIADFQNLTIELFNSELPEA
jgi:hypothetical protein